MMFTFLVAVDLTVIAHLLDARGKQEKLTNNDINVHAFVCVYVSLCVCVCVYGCGGVRDAC